MITKLRNDLPRYINRYLQTAADRSLEAAYALPTHGLRPAAIHLTYQLAMRIKRISMPTVGRVVVLEGISPASSKLLKAGLVGQWTTDERNSLHLYQHHLFGNNSVAIQDLGMVPVEQYASKANEIAGDVDLVLLLGHRLAVKPPSSGEWALGPDGVRMAFEISPGESWSEVQTRMRHQRNNIRRIKQSGFHARFSTSEDDFQTFYQQMYLPSVKRRYRFYGDITKERHLHREFSKRGLLILIDDADGNTCGGGLRVVSKRNLYGIVSGVVDGNQELIRRGTLAALYYFGIQFAFENGFRRYDAGNCEPFLNDGVFRHKQLWGCQPYPDYWRPRSVLCWSANGSDSALEWMMSHPFVPQFARWGGEKICRRYASLSNSDNPAQIAAVQQEK